MFFLQAAMAPVPVRFKNRQYDVPKMIMDEIITWAVEVRSERVEAQTADMEDAERRQHMAMFPPVEPDLKEMHLLVGTPSGIKKVLRTCLPKAKGRLVKNNKVRKGVRRKTLRDVQGIADQPVVPRLGSSDSPVYCDIQ
jgi:hypothetical protein